MGAGNVGGILSVDISDWDTNGEYAAKGKIARHCTRDEVAADRRSAHPAHHDLGRFAPVPRQRCPLGVLPGVSNLLRQREDTRKHARVVDRRELAWMVQVSQGLSHAPPARASIAPRRLS
jgi:hypothetical protein